MINLSKGNILPLASSSSSSSSSGKTKYTSSSLLHIITKDSAKKFKYFGTSLVI